MKTTLWAIVPMILLAACGPETGAGFGELTPVTTAATAAPSVMEEEAQIMAMINAERSKRGLVALSYNAQLAKAAERHANDMAAKNYFSHTSKNGAQVGDRVRAVGYCYGYLSENISGGYPTAQQAVLGWMKSDGHRKNILSSQVNEIGIGTGAGGMRVAVFARGC